MRCSLEPGQQTSQGLPQKGSCGLERSRRRGWTVMGVENSAGCLAVMEPRQVGGQVQPTTRKCCAKTQRNAQEGLGSLTGSGSRAPS